MLHNGLDFLACLGRFPLTELGILDLITEFLDLGSGSSELLLQFFVGCGNSIGNGSSNRGKTGGFGSTGSCRFGRRCDGRASGGSGSSASWRSELWGGRRVCWRVFFRRRDTVGSGTGGREEVDADLAFLDGLFGRLFDRLPEGGDIGILIGRGENGLDEEFVTAFGVERRFFFHGLEENWDLSADGVSVGCWRKTDLKLRRIHWAESHQNWVAHSILEAVSNARNEMRR